MKEKNDLIQKINQSFSLKIITCLILSFIVIVLFFIANAVFDKKESRKYTITSDFKLMNQIEDIYTEDNKINIYGYAFLLDMDSEGTKVSILLRSVNDGKEIWADVEQISRTDVASFFSKNYNHENSGFNAIIKESKLSSDECYEIIVKLEYLSIDDNNRISKTVSTNRYIINKELFSYNPYELDHPDIESELLSEVFNNGQLSFYQKDKGMYVFQYNKQLYWIADESFNFDEDGMTSIPCNVYTSKVDKLPENRIQNGFETLGFIFEDHEYTDENIGPYRLAIWDIPDDYPISYIITGEYDSGWVWSKIFHINYIFD